MTNYSLRARMMILILAPTVLIGLLLSIFFVVHRYNDLQRQLEDAGASIIEPLAVSTEYGMSLQNRESIGQLISVLHRRHSDIVRAISVYDENNRLFVTSNFHLDPSSMQLGSNVPFPRQLTVTRDGDIMRRLFLRVTPPTNRPVAMPKIVKICWDILRLSWILNRFACSNIKRSLFPA